jgi:archaeal type IV pilus assembly protein PilA
LSVAILYWKGSILFKKTCWKESAVSPVIGVMLMITVTIILAATLSAFVGGSTGDLKKNPQVTLVVKSDGDGENFNLLFEHQGGDTLRTQDLEIVTWVKTTNGTVVKHVQDPDADRVTIEGTPVSLPIVYESQSSVGTSEEFGSAVWKSGTTAGTWDRVGTAEFLGVDETELGRLIANKTPVEIDIVHRPSGIVILKTETLLGD